VLKFVEHFFWIAAAVDPLGENPDEMWDEEDGFFYDVLRLPDGTGARMKVRSLVGLLPLWRHHGDRGRRHRPLSADRRTRGMFGGNSNWRGRSGSRSTCC